MHADRFTIVMDGEAAWFSVCRLTAREIGRKWFYGTRERTCLQATYFDDDEAIGPEDLKLLHDVMVELCDRAGIETRSAEASTLASTLVSLFKSGFRSRPELMFMAAK